MELRRVVDPDQFRRVNNRVGMVGESPVLPFVRLSSSRLGARVRSQAVEATTALMAAVTQAGVLLRCHHAAD
eukprot:137730-Amphidinium_carterae.1